jgi:hypothetical protein
MDEQKISIQGNNLTDLRKAKNSGNNEQNSFNENDGHQSD